MTEDGIYQARPAWITRGENVARVTVVRFDTVEEAERRLREVQCE